MPYATEIRNLFALNFSMNKIRIKHSETKISNIFYFRWVWARISTQLQFHTYKFSFQLFFALYCSLFGATDATYLIVVAVQWWWYSLICQTETRTTFTYIILIRAIPFGNGMVWVYGPSLYGAFSSHSVFSVSTGECSEVTCRPFSTEEMKNLVQMMGTRKKNTHTHTHSQHKTWKWNRENNTRIKTNKNNSGMPSPLRVIR